MPLRPAGRRIAKGSVLTADDIAMLAAAGIGEIIVAHLDAGDVGEDDAAQAHRAGAGGAGHPRLRGRDRPGQPACRA